MGAIKSATDNLRDPHDHPATGHFVTAHDDQFVDLFIIEDDAGVLQAIEHAFDAIVDIKGAPIAGMGIDSHAQTAPERFIGDALRMAYLGECFAIRAPKSAQNRSRYAS